MDREVDVEVFRPAVATTAAGALALRLIAGPVLYAATRRSRWSSPDGPRPPAGTTRTQPCTCGHARLAHQHHRRGTDCSLCSCARYTGPLSRLLPWRG